MASQLEIGLRTYYHSHKSAPVGSAASISHRGRACDPLAGRETGTVVRLDAAKLALNLRSLWLTLPSEIARSLP